MWLAPGWLAEIGTMVKTRTGTASRKERRKWTRRMKERRMELRKCYLNYLLGETPTARGCGVWCCRMFCFSATQYVDQGI